MTYTLLGHSGLRASTLCLGTMGFLGNSSWGDRKISWSSTKDVSAKIVEAFLHHGGNIIDTANSYGDSEEWLGELLGAARHEVIISTKYCGSNSPVDVNGSGAHRKSMLRSVERSLRRLRTDYIDVLSLHCWDFLTPVDEVMRALDDLVRSGKVLSVGVSNAPAWIVSMGNAASRLRGHVAFSSCQVEYNLMDRDVEREILPMARALDIRVMAWSPLASGWLTGKYLDRPSSGNGRVSGDGHEPRRLDDPVMGRFVRRSDRNIAIAAEVCRIAAEIDRPPVQVALNWLRQRGVIPIVGARTEEQIVENLRCTEFELEQRHHDALTEIGKISLGYPHAFLKSKIVSQFMYGKHEIVDARRVGQPGLFS